MPEPPNMGVTAELSLQPDTHSYVCAYVFDVGSAHAE